MQLLFFILFLQVNITELKRILKLTNPLLIITPPFTQLNTPYPASAYLKGFLNTKGISAKQADLGIEVILAIFSKKGLIDLFTEAAKYKNELTDNASRILALKDDYIQKIDPIILFLQGKNPTLSHTICQEDFLPKAARFNQLEELDWAFGIMGLQDKAKHLATLFLEDISDLIVETIDPHFGFSRYAERLGTSANSFDALYEALHENQTYTDRLLLSILKARMEEINPKIVAFTVPFPGNLYAAFRSAQFIKKYFPSVKIAMGGGFANTELRAISDVRVFEFFDFITLDDGEAPIEHLLEHIAGKRSENDLKRTFLLKDGAVFYSNNSKEKDYKQSEVGTPDYSDLKLDSYISVIEVVNPMHRLWSDGRWNKLTMAHGCYWGKCTFCDISLDYIKVYEPIAAKLLCDRMEELVQQTGQTGFHFVDEAAPPALMRALALEIIRRKMTVNWWTNIRFEKKFTRDLCLLLKASGCIAVSGGLEVASDRLLKLIDKGVTVEQVARVNRNFTDAGIMVHAYLMYGFPTQTIQETVDSLEMVRQLFEIGVLQSAFWHQFAMTAHSPIGLEPEKYGVSKETTEIGTFANNDIVHIDSTGIDHTVFSYGLKKSLYNFMHGIGFELPLQKWFEFKIPRTTIPRDFIENAIEEDEKSFVSPDAKIVWIGNIPSLHYTTKLKKGVSYENAVVTFVTRDANFQITVSKSEGEWLQVLLELISVSHAKILTFQEIQAHYYRSNSDDFEPFWYGKQMDTLRENGLLLL